MILAAGRGERMRPLTDHTPKPLLPAGGKPLIVYHIEKLAAAGYRELVINHAHLGEQIEHALGDGDQWGVNIHYSAEPYGLETAGGIANAMPLLSPERTTPFAVINGDIFCDYPLSRLQQHAQQLNADNRLAHLVLVNTPPHHPNGDFQLHQGLARNQGQPKLTFSGIGVYHPALFQQIPAGEIAALGPLLRQHIEQQQILAEHFAGSWLDIGTPERLAALEKHLIQESL